MVNEENGVAAGSKRKASEEAGPAPAATIRSEFEIQGKLKPFYTGGRVR